MTATTDKLPDYNDEPVARMAIKFTGAGTGFNGLDVRPIVMELDDFVVRAKAAESPSHFRDKKDALVRMQRLHIEEMAPIGSEVAVKAMREWAQEVKRIKAEKQGQDQLFAEKEAEAAEEMDKTRSPAEVAAGAKQRVKGR